MTQYDVDLLKPALLFADSVTLVTTRVELINLAKSDIALVRGMGIRQYITFLRVAKNAIASELEFFGIKEEWLPTQQEVDARLVEIQEFASQQSDYPANAMEEFLAKYDQAFIAFLDGTLRASRERISKLVSAEIDEAEETGLVRITGWGDRAIHPAGIHLQGQQNYMDELADSAADLLTRTVPGAIMLEPGSAGQLLTRESASAPLPNSANRIAASFVGMLPGLRSAPMSEVLDVRNDLSEYLPPFRAAILDLSERLSSHDIADPMQTLDEIDKHWHREINPALSEIHAQLARGRYRRHILEEFATSKDSLAATAGAAIAIGGGSLIGGIAALVPGLVAGAYPFVKAMNSALNTRDEAKKNRMYFLYESRKRLQKFAP
ncbi:hypothetical protein [Rhodococcus triatomae]